MPLVAHTSLPTFEKLQQRGQEILPIDTAMRQDIRELHIGLLNMMPDAALQVTEMQFMQLVGNSNQIAQFFVHPFSVPGLTRSPDTAAYIERYYTSFETLQSEGLDALIITGANVANPLLEQEAFWQPLADVVSWASESLTSVLCSCLATHALMKYFYGLDRERLGEKRWGVYSHRAVHPYHPLLRNINTRFDTPHSRYNEITREQFVAAGLSILVESAEAGVHMAVSPDQFRFIYMQGHPEYNTNSLLKEYKREVLRFLTGDREDYPPHPEHYFGDKAATIANTYRDAILLARKRGTAAPPFPETAIHHYLDNTWGDTAKAIFNNWLGLVYKITDMDRHKPFMSGINPYDPLGLKYVNKQLAPAVL
ncbi:MAG: homoserine O-succinyltransferase [Caldilineales bacterium]|nr:homoserine O-succinyltransferase [Caldilineales bacterium]